ncbi:thiol-disulfide oxidoreductase DCC family protein [Streptomyces plumbidurans]|uniref:thiol-disulfide oxidoreductase DCC family protein n=1 Tax=Streptomyces plumbidurans TaxID=2814589 RepID=UPI0027E11CF1|nr:DCC1-like thiol-disulfide oxidoreductase family protein [Streptomyces plumbidurans]
MSGTGVTAADRVPVRRLTVLYDADCSLCAFLRDWLTRQPQLVPLDLVPAASEEARRRFPGLDHRATLDDITVVGDGGQVYRSAAAWIVTLWALREHRPLAHRLSTPTGMKLAKGAVLAAAKWRGTQWGGAVYRPADGWSYDPRQGWTYSAPRCDGGTCVTP